MSKMTTSAYPELAKRRSSRSAKKDKHGMTPEHWARLRAKTNDEINRAALSDPDAQPRTEQQLVRARRISFAKFTRQRLGMTQPQFAETFRIPLGTLRDWEQHRREPDQAARAYLEVIAREPKAVRRALAKVERTMSVGEAVE